MTEVEFVDVRAPLVDLLVDVDRAAELRRSSVPWPSWTLTTRQICDLELLATGAFSPLTSFLDRADLEAVCDRMRLANGALWPIPIMLDVTDEVVAEVSRTNTLALRDPEGVMLGALHVEDAWRARPREEARAIFGTTDEQHAGVAALVRHTEPWYLAGSLEVVQLPVHYDYTSLRHTPAEVRGILDRLGAANVVAFQTRNPMHRAHQELTLRAVRQAHGHLLLHPVVGRTKPGDVDHYTRVRCYQGLLSSYPPGSATLSLLPLAMRMAGPREAVWHALIRANYGATHFIVGRDHAGPGADAQGKPFYGAYEAQALVRRHQKEMGITMVPFRQMVYLPDRDEYAPEDEVPEGATVLSISGTQQRRMLAAGERLPTWFTPPAVARELQRRYPPRNEQGLTIFFTGLSGSGKSTVANVLHAKLLERGRSVSLLDGDLVRRELSAGLGFSRDDRDRNIRRIGYVATEVTRHGGVAICAPIAPYDATRKDVRRGVEAFGAFVLVHLATRLEVCEARDRKGLYAKARAGLVPEFTGISDPYEEPTDAELVLDTTRTTPEEVAERIIAYLEGCGYLVPEPANVVDLHPVG